MEVIICKTCNASGKVIEEKGYNEYVLHECKKCKGTGRLKTVTYSYSVPYNIDTKLTDIIDNKIIDLIKEIENI